MQPEMLIVVTMDCERPRTETRASASGPHDYRASARYIEAYARLVGDRGWPVSFFIHPEVCAGHPQLFRDLAADGACLGLHLHPWKFGSGAYQAHFGGLTGDEQRRILQESSSSFAAAFGAMPLYFRPGTFSANDSTFAVLDELGFRGGSISAPDRVYRDLCSVWTDAPRDPHRGHRAFRLIPGDLDFVNIPLTVDASQVLETNGRRYFRDLRPDYQSADYEAIAQNIVDQILERRPTLPNINLVTHNDNDYADPADRVRGNLLRALDAIEAACAARGVATVGATVETIVDKMRASGEAAPEFETIGVIHGTRGGPTPTAGSAAT